MNLMRFVCLSLVVAAISGCSLCPERVEPLSQAERIGVYESSPPGSQGYRFVKRLWIEPWKSAISVPRNPSVEAGVADLRNQAVALGGDAIVNFACYHAAVDPNSPYYCNGTVIKYLP